MPLFDLPLAKLKTYKAPDNEPKDFDAFWKRTLGEAADKATEPRFERVDSDAYQLVDVYDLTFSGYDGQPVRGWFIEPAGNTKKLPCFVTFIGYGGGRSLPIDHVAPAIAGFANLVMDTRGQGSVWAPGDTPDNVPPGLNSNAQFPGYMTRGIESADSYYYRRVFADAVRAVHTAAAHERVDAKRIAVTGVSQGGGITLAAAGLVGKQAKLCMPDVPYLCHYRRACELVDTAPYNEISQYLKTHRGKVEQVFNTLAYFDGVNFAKRITARSLFSVGLMDTVCPPSTIFAAYNNVAGRKDMNLYEYNHHDGGGVFQIEARLAYARKHL